MKASENNLGADWVTPSKWCHYPVHIYFFISWVTNSLIIFTEKNHNVRYFCDWKSFPLPDFVTHLYPSSYWLLKIVGSSPIIWILMQRVLWWLFIFALKLNRLFPKHISYCIPTWSLLECKLKYTWNKNK